MISALKEWLYSHGLTVGGGGYPIECPSPPRDFDKHVAQHLKSENPRAIELLEDSKDIFEKCKKLRSRLMREVGDVVSKKYEELGDRLHRTNYDVRNFTDEVICEIRNRIEYDREVIKPTRESKAGEPILILGASKVARCKDSNVIDELEELFNELVNAEEFRSKVEEIIKMRREYDEKLEELRRIIKGIVTRCEHGNKLGGKCDNCPKFTWI